MNKSTFKWYILFSLLFTCIFLSGCSENSSDESKTPSISSEKQIIINEVMSSNDIFFPSHDGRFYDWVELHNLTDHTFDLNKCYLTDDERKPFKFQLKNVSLSPHGYTTIYLSGLNQIDANGIPHANFKLSSSGETLYLNDSNGVIISSIHIPESPANISFGFPYDTSRYTDDSCVWFSSPTPNAENSPEYSRTVSDLVYHSNGVIINEYMSDNSFTIYDADGDYPDWIELYNPTQTDADMSGYMLSDDTDSTGKWSFPNGVVIPAGGYLTVFCSGKDTVDSQGYLHTNFSLSTDDPVIILSSYQGATVSQVEMYDLPENVSCGLLPGSSDFKLFARATPGQPNNTSPFDLSSRPSPDINDGILISETLSASSANSDYPTDYIEIHNSLSEEVQLGGYTLSHTPGDVLFTFPETSLAPDSYLLVWCDGTTQCQNSSDLHAPIKLNIGGENLYLADSSGKTVDYLNTGKQSYGVSCGRINNDTATRYFFDSPTPGSQNTSKKYISYAPQPQFSQLGGYVSKDTKINITIPDDCTVRYTTNGIEPDQNSSIYDSSSPINISETTVLKAVAFRDSHLPSETISATYFVEEPHSIPVVSLSGAGLIESGSGILVTNTNYDTICNVHLEYYDEQGVIGSEFDAGAKIFGNDSRKKDRKGLRLKINEQYGVSEITYPFFKNSVSGVKTFSSILLRPSGQDQVTAMIRDELVPSIIRGQVNVDYMEVAPCALYVNGEYWGLYYIRERLDADYLVNKYGYPKDKIDLIKSQIYAQEGTISAYNKLEAFARNNDLKIKENYEYMASLVDFESLCDFWIVETYFANTDSENIRCYQAEDGKWRWMVYDMDWSMWPTHAYANFISLHCLDPKGHGVFNSDNSIIRKLLENEDFKELFISRYCYHINNTFNPERCIAILEQLSGSIRNEVPRNQARWSIPKADVWEENIEFIRGFLEKKPDRAKSHLMTSFNLTEKELEAYLKANK